MTTRRTQKAASAIREVVSMAILADLKDPRVRNVTVTQVEVSGDMRQAKIYVSIMGDETKQSLCLRGLQNSAGFLQSKISDRIDTRYTPKLEFVLDLGVKHSIEIARLLHQVLPDTVPAEVVQSSDQSDELDDENDGENDPEDEENVDAESNEADEHASALPRPDRVPADAVSAEKSSANSVGQSSAPGSIT